MKNMEQATFTKPRLLRLLNQFQADSKDYITVCLTPASRCRHATDLAAELGALPAEIKETLGHEVLWRATERYGTGLVVLWGEQGSRLTILPPFAIPKDTVSLGAADTSLLRQLLEKERVTGIALVNWGSYAVGVFRGDTLIASKAGTGHIHKKHKKGGSSQKRFSRRTEEQKKDFLRRAANRIEETLKAHRLEHLFFGGNQLILKPLLEESAYLKSYAQQISPRHLPLRYTDREALLSSFEHANESLVLSW
jgi:hypothetical protein